MNKIALAAAVVTLSAAPFAMGCAEAQPAPAHFEPPPGAAPPWGTTTTEAPAAPAAVPVSTPAAVQAPSPPGTPRSGTTTPTHAVFLHAGPNGATPVLGTLRPGEPLRVLASAPGGWTQVESSAGSGWAYGSYLAPVQGAEAAPPQEPLPR
jgi:Bacterial SH3 domain